MSDNVGSAYYNQNQYIVFLNCYFLILTKHIANNFDVGICTKSEIDY